ncbi:MAG TPA: hypothetical protein VGA61_13035 [Anaerolineae bacterium]
MGFLDRLLKSLTGGGARSGQPAADERRVYVQCTRCDEPLAVRVDMRNEPSLADDGETYIVRKGLVGSGKRRCFQTIEVILKYNANKQETDRQVNGGRFITAEEYEALVATWPPPEEQEEDA